MAYEAQMRQIARQLISKHGDLSEVNCVSGNNPCRIKLVFADGEKIDVGEHSGRVDISMMKAGYQGTGSRCFYAFLDEAGFDLTYEQVARMKKGTVLRRSHDPSAGEGKEFNKTALEEMVAKGDMQGLIQSMEEHPFETVSALEKLGDKRGVEPLIAILKSRKYGKGHRAVVMALKKIGDERAVEPLAQALSDMDVVVRQEAAEALERIGDERVVKQLTQALQDQNSVVRSYAAAALKRIGGAKDLESLVQNLENLHGEARWKAAEAIFNIGGEKAVEPLLQLLKDESRKVRTIAVRGLGSIGGARAVEPLILALKDVDSDVRTTAATALGRIGDERAVEPLIQALKGQDAQVRWMAAEALGNIGDERAVSSLTHALNDPAVGVQSKAKEALTKIRSVPPPKPGVGDEIKKPRTITVRGTEMMYIPAGVFLMGSDSDEYVGVKLLHEVYLSSFYIARYPVTNVQYKEFVAATEYRLPTHWEAGTYPEGKGNHPVEYVAWYDALAYCSWLRKEVGQEIRLPTEAEWEKAARGTDEREYPWGDEFDKSKCNSTEEWGGDTTPVGKYSPDGDSPYGVADMAGNVWEWCSSMYKPYPYDAADGREDLEVEGEPARVLRGGGFYGLPVNSRCAFRNWFRPDDPYTRRGFRVVVSPSSPEGVMEAMAQPGVGEEIQEPQEKAQKSVWRIAVGAILTFTGLGSLCMLLSGEEAGAPVCFGVMVWLPLGIILLWGGITGKGIKSKSKTRQSPSKVIPSISKPARSPSQPETEPSWVKPLAIASLVLSISAIPASICGCGLLFPPIAVILGLIAYVQTKKSNSPRSIRGMALAGTILGGLLIIILVILIIGSLIWPNGLDMLEQLFTINCHVAHAA